MTNIKIERLNAKDFHAVVDFLKFAIKDTFTKEGIGDLTDDINEEVAEKIKYLKEDIADYGKSRFFFIAKQNKEIVGTIEYGGLSDLITKNIAEDKEVLGKVGTIYVHPNLQRQGIGKKLLLKMMQELKRRNIAYYYLDTGYDAAHDVWTKMFGEPLATLKDYWGEGGHHSVWKISVAETIDKLG